MKFGDIDIENLKVGDSSCLAAYAGDILVWQPEAPYERVNQIISNAGQYAEVFDFSTVTDTNDSSIKIEVQYGFNNGGSSMQQYIFGVRQFVEQRPSYVNNAREISYRLESPNTSAAQWTPTINTNKHTYGSERDVSSGAWSNRTTIEFTKHRIGSNNYEFELSSTLGGYGYNSWVENIYGSWPQGKLTLFCLNTRAFGTTTWVKQGHVTNARIKMFKLYVNNQLVRDLIPVIQSGEAGFYDNVTQQIFFSQSGTPFSYS